MLLQLKPLQFFLSLIHANPPSWWCHNHQTECKAYGSIPQVSEYLLQLKPKPLESDLTPWHSFFSHTPHLIHQQILSALLSKISMSQSLFTTFTATTAGPTPWPLSHLDYHKSLITGLPASVLFLAAYSQHGSLRESSKMQAISYLLLPARNEWLHISE